MRSDAILILFLVSCCATVLAGEEVMVDGIPHVRNPETPAGGIETWRLEERWRVGGDDDDTIFGLVSQAVSDAEGNVYLLDQQLCHVLVYSPDGRLLRTLGREGDGPGEFRMPWDLALLPEGIVGVGMTMPGSIVLLDSQGNPAGSIPIGGADAAGFHVLDQVKCAGGQLAVVGRTVTNSDKGLLRTRFLATLDFEGNEKARLIEESAIDPITEGKYVERDSYFVNLGRWALGPDGRIYAAPGRDHYRIHVFTADGRLERIIERDYRRQKRTPEEKARVGEGMMAISGGERIQLEIEAEDYPPCIAGLSVTENGELWVRHSRSGRDLPDDVLVRYDVFDAEGHFARQVQIACEGGDPERDQLFVLGGDRMLVVKNYGGAVRGMMGGESGDDEAEETEPAPLEVVSYTVAR